MTCFDAKALASFWWRSGDDRQGDPAWFRQGAGMWSKLCQTFRAPHRNRHRPARTHQDRPRIDFRMQVHMKGRPNKTKGYNAAIIGRYIRR